MTNEELKNIIARHVCNACEFGHGFDGKCDIGNDYRKCNICGETAEALILEGIGDVKEAKRRAEVTERAVENLVRARNYLAAQIYLGVENGDALTVDYYMRQAERQLAKEEEK